MVPGPGYQALREGAAWFDLSSRGVIRVNGDDRARLLHALSTNHIQQLQTGQGCYAFFLTAQGKIIADAYFLCLADHFLLDVEPQAREVIFSHIDHYIIADDVTVEDVSDSTAVIAIEGPQASARLREFGATPRKPGPLIRSGTAGRSHESQRRDSTATVCSCLPKERPHGSRRSPS